MAKKENKIDFLDEFIEKAAELEHTRWANWQKHLHSKLFFDAYTTGWVLSEELKKHYEELIAADYNNLSEENKEKDRVEVRKYLPLIKEFMLEYIKDKMSEKIKALGRDKEDEEDLIYEINNITL